MKAETKVQRYDVIIIGGGASGLFAAAETSGAGLKVMILEPNRILGRKLRITGKGRCNLTNNCTAEEVMKNFPRNPKFLYSALTNFPPEKIISWFESAGVPLKTERGKRVFPKSECAADVAEALVNKCKEAEIIHEKANQIIFEKDCPLGVQTNSGTYYSDYVILATGGRSYPLTGSDGSGYKLSEALGHTVIKQQPSLVPIVCVQKYPGAAGLTIKNAKLYLYSNKNPKRPLWHEQGELCFEKYGISGPLALTASCIMDSDRLKCKEYILYIDFKPALNEAQLDSRLLREIASAPKGNLSSMLRALLPLALIEPFVSRLSVDKSAVLGNLTREGRREIVSLLKRFPLYPESFRGYDEAIVTRGGVSVKEINPRTMESKLVNGLYFAGEIIDVDGFTGGYNLTEAFSTAYCAAEDIIRKKKVTDS